MNEDARLERTLRDVLDARDPGRAPDSLRRRLDAVPGGTRPEGRVRVAVRRFGPYLAVAAALVVLLAGLGALGPGGSQVAGPGAGPSSTFDPYLTGIGVVDPPNQVLVVLVVVALTAVCFYGAGLVGGRKGGALAVLSLVLPGAFLLSQVVAPPVAAGGGYNADSGLADGTELGYEYGAVPGGVVTVKPGEPYSLLMVVANRSIFPLRLDGIVADPAAAPGVVDPPSLWLGLDEQTGWERPDTPFAPQWLAPGASLNVWLVQRASSCTVPPGASVASSSQSAITLRWSAFGVIPRRDGLELPYMLDTPLSSPCPAS